LEADEDLCFLLGSGEDERFFFSREDERFFFFFSGEGDRFLLFFSGEEERLFFFSGEGFFCFFLSFELSLSSSSSELLSSSELSSRFRFFVFFSSFLLFFDELAFEEDEERDLRFRSRCFDFFDSSELELSDRCLLRTTESSVDFGSSDSSAPFSTASTRLHRFISSLGLQTEVGPCVRRL
jgi:hypothetical protein